MKNKLLQLMSSRKFWAALVGLILVIVKAFYPDFPVDEEQLTSVIYVLSAYILGVAVEDGFSKSPRVVRTVRAPLRREEG